MRAVPADPQSMTEKSSTVVLAREGAVLHVRIERPARRNALSGSEWSALAAAFSAIGDARVLLLSGVPGAFCAGADIDELSTLLADPQRMAANNVMVQATQLALERLPIPTIAGIDGVCVGGGLGLALACDFRIATSRSRFAITPARLGLVYSPEDTRRLVAAVGAARAKDLLLSGRMLDAAEAHQYALLSRVVADDGLQPAVDALLATLLSASRSACAGIKQVVAHVAGDPAVDRDSATRAFVQAFSSSDFAEGAQAFIDRRPPVFE